MKKIIAIIIIILLVYFGVSYSFKKENKQKKDTQKYETITIKRGNIILKTSASGTVISNFDVEIKSKSSGEIIKLPFDISDKVKKGDLIAELDPIDEQRNVEKKELDLSTSKANLLKSQSSLKNSKIELKAAKIDVISKNKAVQIEYENALKTYKRHKELLRKKFISPETFEKTSSNLEKAKNNLELNKTSKIRLNKLEYDMKIKEADVQLATIRVKTAEINLKDALKRLNETKIYSPIDGFISESSVQLGQIIASGISNVGGGTKLFVVSDLSKLFIDVAIDESDISKLKKNNTAFITVDAYPNKKFKGKVIRIGVKGQLQNNIVNFKVKLEVIDKDAYLLKPGMTASVDIITNKKMNIITVPANSLIETKKGFCVLNSKHKKIKVKVGLNSFEKYEITDGLKENDKILIPIEENSKWKKSNNKRSSLRAMRMGSRGKK